MDPAGGVGVLAAVAAGLVSFLSPCVLPVAFDVVKRHYRVLLAAGGTVLIVMGVLIWTGELFQLNVQAQRVLDDLGLNFFNEV